eukprot:752218-Hanusia_phi.AAC.5
MAKTGELPIKHGPTEGNDADSRDVLHEARQAKWIVIATLACVGAMFHAVTELSQHGNHGIPP